MEYQGSVNNGGSTSSQGLRRKRLKVAVACAACRRRKIKCGGAQPVRNACGKSSTSAECVYSNRSRQRSYTLCSEEIPPRDIPTANGPLLQNSVGASSALNDSERVDSMNGVTGDPTQIREATLDTRLETPHSATHRRSLATGEHSLEEYPSFSSHEEPGLFLLPPRGLADGLIQAYWDNEWVLYPVIHRQKIEETYELLWMSKTSGNYPLIHICIINVCFALECHYCELMPVKERKTTGDDFFGRAQRLYERLGDVPSYEKTSTSNVFQCWMTVGQVIRMAQYLGIHLSQSTSFPESSSHEEYKRRTWHGCVWLDRVLSATFGRPVMIPKWLFNSVPLPSMINNQFFGTQTEGSVLRPDGRPCVMAFAVKAMEFYQILDDILVNLYLNSTKDDRCEGKLTHILAIDARIQTWNKSLPDHLRAQSVALSNSIFDKQAIVSRIRNIFLHVRTLLFRLTVVRYCMRRGQGSTGNPNDSNDSSLSEVMLSECSRMCFRLAHELIHTFHRNLDRDSVTGPLPNWWYFVLYVYTAATMILVERFLETRESASESSTASDTWKTSLHVLETYSTLAESARKCLAALELFSEKLFLDGNKTVAASRNEEPQDWNSFWGISDLLSEELGMSDPVLFPFNFDDFISFDSMPGPYVHISPPHGT
ncbi:fungal-specific transcription factor domain-containing protein [Aspergillus caelatus]|uniref:Fungal-specific transcription factor domain-containing protein n=1 Tax=Aspergillus caelatus TaxID=61420 RepID=A0A5N6ZL64_9EURO|nr:fungal-specific transcription factor domain-containing protein [Aspergillus caelatus]KAE8358215.1 fungal-specific transcription factor domain-containing protein [Aspergillus caelatus]